jgi:midasin
MAQGLCARIASAQAGNESKGVEMEADFEGELHDLAPDERPEDGDDGDDDGDADEERLHQEMGDVGDDGEVVDERLWGDDDKEEGPQGQQQHGKDAADEKAMQVWPVGLPGAEEPSGQLKRFVGGRGRAACFTPAQ